MLIFEQLINSDATINPPQDIRKRGARREKRVKLVGINFQNLI